MGNEMKIKNTFHTNASCALNNYALNEDLFMRLILFKNTLFLLSLTCINLFYIQAVLASDSHNSDASQEQSSNVESLSIDDVIVRVMDASPRFQSVVKGIDVAKGEELQAGFRPNPELSLEAEDFAGSDQFGGTNSAEYTLSVNQKIEFGGKRDARKKVAQASFAVAQEDVSIERLNIIRDVHAAYLNVLVETESVDLASEQQQLAEDLLNSVNKRVSAAAESEIQKSKAEVSVANTLIQKEQTSRQLQIARHNLAKLWGAVTFNEHLDKSYLLKLEEPESYEYFVEKLSNLPDMQRLALESERRDSLFNLAKTERNADPTVSVGVRRFEEGSDNAFLVGLSIPLQVFNKNQGNIAKAQAEVDQTDSDSQQFELNLKQSLFENWQNWKTAYSEASHLKTKLLPAADKSFHLAQSAYKRGRFTYLEVLDSQRTLINARDQYLNTLRRYHSARINVKRLTNSFGE
jgi:cobalt-zinc-cadmium efflux system outer membrane protein